MATYSHSRVSTFKNYLRINIPEYKKKEDEIIRNGKIITAKILCEENISFKPDFIKFLVDSLSLKS